jgi:hypothetical protein
MDLPGGLLEQMDDVIKDENRERRRQNAKGRRR